jgi:hypothetical protein
MIFVVGKTGRYASDQKARKGALLVRGAFAASRLPVFLGLTVVLWLSLAVPNGPATQAAEAANLNRATVETAQHPQSTLL